MQRTLQRGLKVPEALAGTAVGGAVVSSWSVSVSLPVWGCGHGIAWLGFGWVLARAPLAAESIDPSDLGPAQCWPLSPPQPPRWGTAIVAARGDSLACQGLRL